MNRVLQNEIDLECITSIKKFLSSIFKAEIQMIVVFLVFNFMILIGKKSFLIHRIRSQIAIFKFFPLDSFRTNII